MALKPASTKRSSRSNDVALSAVQPKTLPPKTSGAMDRPVRPRGRICMGELRAGDLEGCRPDIARGAGDDTCRGVEPPVPGPKRQHPPREEVRRVSFGWRTPGRRSVPAYPSFTGRRWIPTEFVNLVPRFGEETAPVAGGGATGAIWVADTGEEVGAGLSVVHREEVDPDGIRQSRSPLRGGSTGRGRRCDRC
jgi:hypothetical protein